MTSLENSGEKKTTKVEMKGMLMKTTHYSHYVYIYAFPQVNIY